MRQSQIRSVSTTTLPISLLCCTVLGGWLGESACGQTLVCEEVRQFDVLVKDKPAGTNTIRIRDFNDGTTRVETVVDVKISFVVFSYRYEFRGQETWRDRRLISTENQATDDGKKFTARAEATPAGFQVETNGRGRREPLIDMTTNFWRVPVEKPDQSLALMNADRGTIHIAKVERLASQSLDIGAQQVSCSHYRVSGDVEAELWFDGQGRIVRQKSIEDGYPTELRLTHLRRETPRTAQLPPPRPAAAPTSLRN